MSSDEYFFMAKKIAEELKSNIATIENQIDRYIRVYPKIKFDAQKFANRLAIPKESALVMASMYHFLTINEFLPDTYSLDDFILDVKCLFDSLFGSTTGLLAPEDYKKILLSFVRIHISFISVSYTLLKRYIDEKGKDLDDSIVKAVLIREIILDGFKASFESLKKLGYTKKNPDIRFLAALLKYTLIEAILGIKSRMESKRARSKEDTKDWLTILGDDVEIKVDLISEPIHKIYEKNVEEYPLSCCGSLFFDILYFQVLTPLYSSMYSVSEDLIEKRREEINTLTIIGDALKAQENAYTEFSADGSVMKLNLEAIIGSALHVTRKLPQRQKNEIERIVDVMLRQKMVNQFGNLYIKDKEAMLKLILDDIFQIILNEPLLALSIVDQSKINELLLNPAEYMKKNKGKIKLLFEKKFKSAVGSNISYFTIANAVSKLVETSVIFLKTYQKPF
ncbi:MAG: hypothetical protein J7L47_11250 [Candidatus Odinarchaeota archaeon]|nr:hypothetical protein [Candidatus Odinarchaeota archaeon]